MALTCPALLAAPVAAQSPTPQVSPSPAVGPAGEMADILTRFGYFNPESVEVEVILAIPEFFCLTDRWIEALDLGADQVVVFVASQWHHGIFEGRPEQFVPILQVDGLEYHVAAQVHLLADDGHRRTIALVFGDLPVSTLQEVHRFEMLMPATPDGIRGMLGWETPIEDLPVVDMAVCSAGPAREIVPSHDHETAAPAG